MERVNQRTNHLLGTNIKKLRIENKVTFTGRIKREDVVEKLKASDLFVLLSDNETFPNKGVFKYSDNSVNKNSGNVNIYVDFENLSKTLLPNAYVTVMIKQAFKQAVKILKDYVWLEENGSFVYVIRNGKIEKIEIWDK